MMSFIFETAEKNGKIHINNSNLFQTKVYLYLKSELTEFSFVFRFREDDEKKFEPARARMRSFPDNIIYKCNTFW